VLFASTTAALRCSPASFARFTGDFRNAALNSSCDIATNSVASVRASFPALYHVEAGSIEVVSGFFQAPEGPTRLVQVVAPLVVLAIQIACSIIYYPVVKLSRNCLVNLTAEAPGYFDY